MSATDRAEPVKIAERPPPQREYARALVNILEDLSHEEERLRGNQAAILNILDDFSGDKVRLESAQGAITNILEDFSTDKEHLEMGQAAILNILEDFDDERKKVEQVNAELERRALELEAANTELEDFTYVVSHDLKEPLRGIEAFSMFLAEDYADKLDEQGERYVNVLREAAVRMRDLIEDLLQLSRIGQVRPEYATVAVESLLEDVRRDLHFALTEKGMDLRIQSDLSTVTCDPSRIKQVFENLVSNAIKFSDKPQPVVEITCHENDGSCVFSVRDNGIGIDEKYHEKIFGIFQRLGRREEYEGTGIGLTICKKIVEGHGGKIWVESKVGESTKFSFSIPKETQQMGQGKETQDGRGTDPDSHSPRRGQSSRRRDNGESPGERTSEEPVDSGTRRPGGS